MWPSLLQANKEPMGRGEEPQVLTTVHNQLGLPSRTHCVSCFKTCWSAFSMAIGVCGYNYLGIVECTTF